MTRKISLTSYCDSCPEGRCVVGFYTSVGEPNGREIFLDPPGNPGHPFLVAPHRIKGSVDQYGVWRWDGRGPLKDSHGATVLSLSVWYDPAIRARPPADPRNP